MPLGFYGWHFGTKPTVTSNDTQAGGNALMARLNYIMSGKYLLTASIREMLLCIRATKSHSCFPQLFLWHGKYLGRIFQ